MKVDFDRQLDPPDDDPDCLGDPWACHCPRCWQAWCERRAEWAEEKVKEGA
jgi:hypothetical protein